MARVRLVRVRGIEGSMDRLFGLGSVAFGGLFLASCVTYPYGTAFSSCESEANACYRLCEDIPDESGYVACQAHCDADIDRCFDTAYSPYGSGYYSGYGYSSPWYGQYGAWYPNTGYYFSFNHYDRYGYRQRRHHPSGDPYWRDGRRNYGDHRDRGGNRGSYDRRDGRRDGPRDNRDWRNRQPNASPAPQPSLPPPGDTATAPRPRTGDGGGTGATPRNNRFERGQRNPNRVTPSPDPAARGNYRNGNRYAPQNSDRTPGNRYRRTPQSGGDQAPNRRPRANPGPGNTAPQPQYTPPQPQPTYTPPPQNSGQQSAPPPNRSSGDSRPPPRNSPRNSDNNRQPD